MVKLSCSPKFKKTNAFFERIQNYHDIAILDKYGKEGVDALREATPKKTGKTSESWIYEIHKYNDRIEIQWKNTNIVDGVPIALILQYGHATRNGGYVTGIDYINPAMKPIFKKISDRAWKEVNGE